MKGVERIVTAVGLGEPDVPPVMPVMLMQGARMLGISLSTYFSRPTRLAEGQLRLLERFDADAVFAVPHVVQDVLPWGAKIDFHDDGPPSVNGMVLRRVEDCADVKAPDPASHPYLRSSLEAARGLAHEVKGDRLIVGAVIGPFSLPTMLLGTRRFLELLLAPADVQSRYLAPLQRACLDFSVRWAQAQLDAGCDIIVFAEGVSSASMLDERTFLAHSLPVLDQFVQRVKGLTALELVGHAEPFMRHVAKLGVAAYLVGEADSLVQARRDIGRAKALIGSINNLKLLRWAPERVEFEARRLIAQAGPGFVLSNQGPEVPFGVPDASIDAMIRAARTARIHAKDRRVA